MKCRTISGVIAMLACLAFASSCSITRVNLCGVGDKAHLLGCVIPEEIDFRDAVIFDVLRFLDETISEQDEEQSLNLMIFTQDWSTNWSTYLVTYQATNVTVGTVLQKATRQTGLEVAFLAGATLVATPESVSRIRALSSLPSPASQALADKLEERLEIWDGCMANIYDIAAYVEEVMGVKMVVTEAGDAPLLFEYRPNTRNMKLKHFLWWLSVLSGTKVTYVNDAVKFQMEKPNKMPRRVP